MVDYQVCVKSERKKPVVEQSVTADKARGFNGTPSFQFIDESRGETHRLVGGQPLTTFDQGQFWPMHHLLFDASDRWSGDDTDADSALRTLVDELGLDSAAFGTCLNCRRRSCVAFI